METIDKQKEERKEQRQLLKTGLIEGKWKLTYKLTNKLGPEGFSGRMIGPYTDPLTGKERHLYNTSNQRRAGFLIDKQVLTFDSKSPEDRLIIDFLVGHPLVGVDRDHTKLEEAFFNKKESNPRIKLINLDHQDVEDIESESFVDILVGKISQDKGPGSLSLEKLRFILAHLNLDYREEKLINKPSVELQKLKHKLKKYCKASLENAKEVDRVMDDLDHAKFIYEIKEMLRVNLISQSGGTFMYQGSRLGISFESIIDYFKNNPEFYAELSHKLHNKLKSESNNY